MKLKDIRQKFIINTLLPYFKDPSKLAVDGRGKCRYKTEDGRKCAIGQHIDGRKYKERMEGNSAFALTRDYPNCFKPSFTYKATGFDLSNPDDRVALNKIQRVHDFYPDDSEYHLEDLEEHLEIDLSELKEYL